MAQSFSLSRLLVVLSLVLASSPPLRAQGYHIEDLGTFGGKHSQAFAINQAGQVVGAASSGGQPEGFLWTEGVLQRSGSPYTSSGVVSCINNANPPRTAGWESPSSGGPAFGGTPNGGFRIEVLP